MKKNVKLLLVLVFIALIQSCTTNRMVSYTTVNQSKVDINHAIIAEFYDNDTIGKTVFLLR